MTGTYPSRWSQSRGTLDTTRCATNNNRHNDDGDASSFSSAHAPAAPAKRMKKRELVLRRVLSFLTEGCRDDDLKKMIGRETDETSATLDSVLLSREIFRALNDKVRASSGLGSLVGEQVGCWVGRKVGGSAGGFVGGVMGSWVGRGLSARVLADRDSDGGSP